MSVYVSSLLTATAATVNADPASTRTWQWQRNGVNIPGATNSTYSAAPADIGSNLFVVQTETNFLGSNNASASVGPVVAFSPIALFQDGSQGWWYDDNDTTTLFQDSAGTTPVTAVEQFVGLQLDKSKGLVLGPELVTNGSFTTDTDWTKGVGWTISGGAANANIATGSNLDQTATTTSGKFYAVTYTVLSYVSGGVRVRFTGTANVNGTVRSANGTYTEYINATATNNVIRFTDGGAGFVGSIDNISVRELPGNHRYAPASGNRPIWSKRVNLLTKTEQFDNAAWTKQSSAITVTPNATVAPDGTVTADLFTEDLLNNAKSVYQLSVNQATGYTASVYVKANSGTRFMRLVISSAATDFAYVTVAIADGSITQPASVVGTASNASASVSSIGNGWYRISLSATLAAASNFVFLIPLNSGTAAVATSDYGRASYLGDGSSWYVWGADIRPANQATGTMPLYQRVNTSSDYDTNGFPGYLKADGVDDFLQTNSINFTATDKITLCAGVRKLSDAATGVFTELSADINTNNGTYAVYIQTSGRYTFISKGTTDRPAQSAPSSTPVPITNVLTGIGEVSTDTSLLRVNGTQVASNTGDQGTGNFGNYPVYFFQRNGPPAANRFNGYEYGNVAVGKLLTADQLTALETYMNGLTKAY